MRDFLLNSAFEQLRDNSTDVARKRLFFLFLYKWSMEQRLWKSLANDKEDFVQNFIIEVLQILPLLLDTPPFNLSAFLGKIWKRRQIDFYRKIIKEYQRRDCTQLEERLDLPSSIPSPENIFFSNLQSTKIKSILDSLNAQHRLIADLRFVESKKPREIAVLQKLTVDEVYKTIRRIKYAIREKMSDEESLFRIAT